MKDAYKEWTSPYNEFNSMKILYFREYLEAIAKGQFLPPVMADTDPTNLCNFDCIWCNSKAFRGEHPASMPSDHLLKLADFYKKWGLKSTCVSGGGEPMLHPAFAPFLYRLKEKGIKSGIICNGSCITDENATAVVKCSSWCGISMDAATDETYAKIKGIKEGMFQKTIKNIKRLVKAKEEEGSNVELTYKYLVHPLNAGEILKAVKIAKSLGLNTFHLRPVCWDNLYNNPKESSIDFSKVLDEINEQIDRARDLEDEHFKFFGVRHKFGEKFERKVNFKKCLATPLLATFGADGNVHLCFDVRGKKEWILCSHYPDPEEVVKIWGGEKHKKIIESVDPKKCPRCTFSQYNEVIENVVLQDKMYMDFI